MYRPVVLRGTWLAQHTVFLDNRQMNGKPGFYVVTPLRLEGSGAVVLVERGWAQRNFVDREQLPPVQTPPGRDRAARAHGPASRQAIRVRRRSQPVPIRQNLDLAQWRAETGLPLLDVAVQQTGAPSEGLLRDWPEAGSGAGEKLRLCLPVVGLERPDRNPLCLVPVHRPSPQGPPCLTSRWH